MAEQRPTLEQRIDALIATTSASGADYVGLVVKDSPRAGDQQPLVYNQVRDT